MTGDSAFAESLRNTLRARADGVPVLVEIAAPPAAEIDLDPDNDWLLQRWAEDEARLAELGLETDYDDNLADAPAAARQLLAELEASPEEPGVLY